jgi:hypothetical protein
MLGKRKSTSSVTWGLFYIPRITRDNGIFVTDKGGYIFSNFFKALAAEKEMRLPPLVLKHPDEAANEYVRNYDMVIVLKDPEGTKICYSVEYRNKLPLAFADRIKTFMQVMPDDTVLWSDNVLKDPQEAPAREVIYGQKPEKPPRRETRADIRKKWAHPGELKPDELNYLLGKSQEPPKGTPLP